MFVSCNATMSVMHSLAGPDRWHHSQHLVLNTNLPAAVQKWHTLLLPFSSILDILIIAHSFPSICNKLWKIAPAWEICWLSVSLVGNVMLYWKRSAGKKFITFSRSILDFMFLMLQSGIVSLQNPDDQWTIFVCFCSCKHTKIRFHFYPAYKLRAKVTSL